MPEDDLFLKQGDFSLYITRDPKHILKAQELRYKVFFNEMSGRDTNSNHKLHLDSDEYDALCDHMIVYDNSFNTARPIGTYRFLRPEFMKKIGRFYTETEFDLHKLINNFPGKIVEVGRSCVDSEYRKGGVIKFLWGCIALYLEKHDIDLLFGCASFAGDVAEKHAMHLSYLHHYHLIDENLRPTPLEEVKANFKIIDKELINEKRAFASLPPLIKGYLRLGGKVGSGAVIDHNVNTTDVCTIVKKTDIAKRYIDFLTPN